MQPSMRESSQRGFLLPCKLTDTLGFGLELGWGLAANLQVEISLLLLVVGQIGFSSCISSSGAWSLGHTGSFEVLSHFQAVMAVAPEGEFGAVAAELLCSCSHPKCEGHAAISRVQPLPPSGVLEAGPASCQGVILQQLQCQTWEFFGVALEWVEHSQCCEHRAAPGTEKALPHSIPAIVPEAHPFSLPFFQPCH